jgi:predicted permease
MATLSLRLYRRALAASREFQAQWLDEAVSALHMAMTNERQRRGALAAAWLWIRAMADAIGLVGQSGDGGMWRAWGQDLRQSIRGLNRSRQYAATVIVTLALAIGGVTAVFQLADPMLFRRLPFPQADRLVRVSVQGKGLYGGVAQFPDYFRAEAAGVFEKMGTVYGPLVTKVASAGDDAEVMLGYAATRGFLDMLDLPVQRGRAFTDAEYDGAPATRGSMDETGAGPVLITDGFWQSEFGRRDDIVGQRLLLRFNGQDRGVIVVGVLAKDFVLPDALNAAPVFMAPGRLNPAEEAKPESRVILFGRLRENSSVQATTDQLAAVIAGVEKDYPSLPQGRTLSLESLQETLFKRVRVPLSMLLAVAAGVLVLAVGNLSHLSLSRAQERNREVAVRAALGGGSWRIARLLMTEALLLAIAGTAAALVLSQALFAIVMAAVPRLAHLYRLIPADMSLRVVGVTLGLAALSFLVFGMMPAVRVVRLDVCRTLQQNGRASRGRSRRTNTLLTALQSSLAASVLVVTILLATSFVRLVLAVKGIDETGVVTATFELPQAYTQTPQQASALFRDLTADVGRATGQRFGWEGGIPGFTLPGGLWRTADTSGNQHVATAYPMDRSALDTFRFQLVAGRLYTDEEAAANAPVAVIDRRTSELLWPGQDPLGRSVFDYQVRFEGATMRVVVGMVESVRVDFKDTADDTGFAFVPINPRGRQPTMVWRGRATPLLAQTLRDALRVREPAAKVGIRAFEPFERRFGEPRLLARMIGVLGVLTLLLTVTGVYAVVSHATAGRTGEIGVRVALGATSARLRAMIVREALWPAAIGVVVGLAAAFWWAVRLKDLLFQVEPRSPWVFAAASLLVTVVVIIASGIPATSASKLNPVDALRAD